MKQIFRKSIAILLVLVQLLVLCPFGIMQAQAAEAQAASAAVPGPARRESTASSDGSGMMTAQRP